MNRLVTAILLVFALLMASGCKRAPKLKIPPVVQIPPPPVEPEPAPAVTPEIEVESPVQPEVETPETLPEPEPVPTPPIPEPPPSPPTAPGPVSETPAPSLSPILPPEQRQRYNRQIDANLVNARRNLEILEGRELTAGQQASLDRIRAFLRQTESMRQTDLGVAVGLSRRAAVLSEELVRATR